MLVFLYCPAAILCSTCFSYFFDRNDSAQSILPNILTFVGLIPFILVIFLDMLGIGKCPWAEPHRLADTVCVPGKSSVQHTSKSLSELVTETRPQIRSFFVAIPETQTV